MTTQKASGTGNCWSRTHNILWGYRMRLAPSSWPHTLNYILHTPWCVTRQNSSNSRQQSQMYCEYRTLISILQIVKVHFHCWNSFKSNVTSPRYLSTILLVPKNFMKQSGGLWRFFLILYHILKFFWRKFTKIPFAVSNTICTVYVRVVYFNSF